MFASRFACQFLMILALACRSPVIDLQPIGGAAFEPTMAEKELWRAAEEYHAGLEGAGLILESEDLQSYLQSQLDALLAAAQVPIGSARVFVVEDRFMNASMLPNGTMYIHTALLSRMENEAQLITLLGHELAHFLLRHSFKEKLYTERQRTNRILNRVAVAILLLPVGLPGLVLNDLEDDSLKAILAPQVAGFSRNLETEADRYAFEAMSRAGYAPAASERLFQLLADEAKLLSEEVNLKSGYTIKDPYYYASHPDLVDRAELYRQLRAGDREFCPSAFLEGAGNCGGESEMIGAERYMSKIESMTIDGVRNDLKLGRRKSAVRIMERHVRFHPSSAQSWALLGEARSVRGWDDSQRDQAIFALEQAVSLDPELSTAHRELGLLYQRKGQNNKAAESLRRYLATRPDAPDRPIVEGLIGNLE